MRLRSPLYLFLALVTMASATACDKATAPDPIEEVTLPPFEQQTVTVYLWSDGYSYGNNHLVMYTPAGVDPIFDLVIEKIGTNSPKLEAIVSRSPDQSTICVNNCNRTVWNVDVSLKAGAVGQARATISLRSKPSEKSSFIITVVKMEESSGKG